MKAGNEGSSFQHTFKFYLASIEYYKVARCDLKNCFINFKRFHIGTLHSFSISFAMNSMHDELETL